MATERRIFDTEAELAAAVIDWLDDQSDNRAFKESRGRRITG